MRDFVVIGGGIVGLAVADALSARLDGASIVVLEKEPAIARHQTGRNSGVIHSGIYYRPGSLKAELATRASHSMVEFCQEHGIAHQVCGKLVVATKPDQASGLERLAERGRANGIAVEVLTAGEAAEREPHLRCEAALWVPSAGIVDYKDVAATLAERAQGRGVEIRVGTRVTGIERRADSWHVTAGGEAIEGRFLVTSGGLQSDRLAALAGADPGAQIIPFRGEFFDVVGSAQDLVKGLIYPLPDLRFPFLGVHLTRGIHSEVHAGPNAVLALAREGYRWRDVSPRDLAQTLRYPGFWRLARQHWRYGASEVVRSVYRRRFVAAVQSWCRS